jgi:hypothetical protein
MLHNNVARRYLTYKGYLWRVEGWPPCGFKK